MCVYSYDYLINIYLYPIGTINLLMKIAKYCSRLFVYENILQYTFL